MPAACSCRPEVQIAADGAAVVEVAAGLLGPHVRRPEARRHASDYLRGLIADVERKNGWQLAEHAGYGGAAVRRSRGVTMMVESIRSLVTVFAALLLLPDVGLAQDDASAWARLGPLGPIRIGAVAVAPDWGASRLLLAHRGDDLVRSSDGGATWERLARPSERLRSLQVAPAFAGSRPAFAIAELGPEWGLYRSADAGDSWDEVLRLSAQPELVLSPDFATDGLALLTARGELRRSRDGGATWELVGPAPGQWVAQAVFSPAFAADRTIVVAAVSGDFPSVFGDADGAEAARDHELSVGVLVSTDAGERWEARSTGLEVDGTAYRHVQRLAVSPTFAQDGVLFAFAWGPREPMECLAGRGSLGWRGALFRSDDRGLSWQRVRVDERSCYRTWAELALSPSFPADGVALLAESSAYVTPASSNCTVLRTADRGASWETAIPSGSYESCSELRLVGSGGGIMGLVRKKVWNWSSDAGQTWDDVRLPSGLPEGVAVAGEAGSDATLFVGASHGGVWALGPGVRSTDGTLPCPGALTGGFGRVWQADSYVRGVLGCPLEAERSVRVRERQVDRSRAYLTEDDQTFWFELADTSWSERDKTEKPWPADSERVVDGVTQRFEGGTMLWVPRADGSRTILVLIGPGHELREFAD